MYIRFLLGTLVAACLAASAAADDAIEFKVGKPKVGDRTKTTREEQTASKFTVVAGGMDQVKEEKKGQSMVYVEEVLAVAEGADRATKLTRKYEKARTTLDDNETTLGIEGKTVLIEKKGETYTFTVDGKEVDADSLDLLTKEFSKEIKQPRDVLLPKKPVKVGDTWKIDPEDVVKGLASKEFSLDKDKIEATGKLLKAYKKNGNQFGVIELKFTAPVTAIGEAGMIKLKDSTMTVTLDGDGCVDGASGEGTSKSKMTFVIDGEGPGFTIKGGLTGTMNRTVVELPKK